MFGRCLIVILVLVVGVFPGTTEWRLIIFARFLQLVVTVETYTNWLGAHGWNQPLFIRAGTTADSAAVTTVVSTINDGELALLATHAHGRFIVCNKKDCQSCYCHTIQTKDESAINATSALLSLSDKCVYRYDDSCVLTRNPDGRMISVRLLPTLAQQIFDTFVDVSHPFLFFRVGCCIHSKAFCCCSDHPAVFILSIIVQRLQLHLFQRNDMLLIVFLLCIDYVTVDEYIVEQEKLTGFWPLAAHFCKNTLTHLQVQHIGTSAPTMSRMSDATTITVASRNDIGRGRVTCFTHTSAKSSSKNTENIFRKFGQQLQCAQHGLTHNERYANKQLRSLSLHYV